MQKSLLCVFIFFIKFSHLFSQNVYSIIGQTNFLNHGTAILRFTALPEFYFEKQANDTAKIIEGRFIFKGRLEHSNQYRISLIGSDKSYISEPFFIESGSQRVVMDSNTKINKAFDYGRGIAVQQSKTNEEYFNEFLPLFENLNQKIYSYYSRLEIYDTLTSNSLKEEYKLSLAVELKEIRQTRDSLFYSYVVKKPTSEIIPWILYEWIRKYGFKTKYEDIFDYTQTHYPNNIRSSLYIYLLDEKLKTIGSKFPLLEYVNSAYPQNEVSKNKFTLIEFWFSRCIPCIAQFEKLKPIYSEHKKRGFEIIAISTDKSASLKKYKSLLKQKKYPWIKILDLNGENAHSINIQKFPSSFLLNQKGEIVLIDVTPESLEDFLKISIN